MNLNTHIRIKNTIRISAVVLIGLGIAKFSVFLGLGVALLLTQVSLD